MPKKMRTRGGRSTTRAAFLVVVMGWGREPDRELARGAAFDPHFAKPVCVERIVCALGSLCATRAGSRGLRSRGSLAEIT
jgi:hypothetical protein